jgi:hypothetical protein
MKNFIKLITLAVIAIFVAVSCAPPLEETGYDWDATNARNDASQYDGVTSLTFGFPTTPIVAAKPEFSVTLPASSDVLRKTTITVADLGFLTFSTFTTPAGNYKASVLDATPIAFTVEKRSGDSIVVKLDRTFTGTYSDVIAKIDGTKFTFSGGLKMDRNGDNKTGEAILDDVYVKIEVIGSTGTNFVKPGDQGWTITVGSPPSYATFAQTGGTYATTSNKTTFNAVGAHTIGLTPAEIKTLFSPLAGQFTLQKWSSGDTWTDAGTAVWDDTANGPVFKDIEFDHKGVYRIVWKGTAITTADEYYGVKQVITFSGQVNQPNVKARDRTEVRSNPRVYNNGSVTYIGASPSPFTTYVESRSSDGKNVVLKVTVDTTGSPAVGLDALDLAAFKNSFKFISSDSSINDFNSFVGRNDYTTVNIEKVEFKAKVTTPATTLLTEIYITLDPSFSISTDNGNLVGGSVDHSGDIEVPEVPGYYDYYQVSIGNDDDDDFASWVTPTDYYTFSGGTYIQVGSSDSYDPDETYFTQYWVDTVPAYTEHHDIVTGGSVEYKPTGGYYYFLVNDKFGYTGGKSVFGSLSNYLYDNFALYGINNP